jgi:predicted AlkP superfamily pyrophosphatase or phosphodiesterase
MRRTTALLLFLLLLASGAFAEERPKKVLLIGIDGTRFDALQKANTPNLDALMKDGIYSDHCLILGDRYQKNDTISGPGWSSILTGVWADKHGVHDNSFKGAKYTAFPHYFALLKQMQPHARTASFVTWLPLKETVVSGADVNEGFAFGKDYAKADVACVAAAVKELAENDPAAVFYYIAQVDESGHAHGFHPTVPEYIAAIERADGLVGQVVKAMQGRKTFAEEDWLVIVTADHGGKGRGHGGGHQSPEILNSFLIVSGASSQRGQFEQQTYIVDAPVTALAHLGVKPKDEWKLDGKAVGLK